ncbi:metallophosphoesterase [Oceanobacillus damuensis]|uniref:metallophosphoesterase n=1 Tax=Oceanobacillus damuensis TaxID=937928 RepID=UPI000830AD28|nr:metallophosphoesterase [Oceanobacillus damuensis]
MLYAMITVILILLTYVFYKGNKNTHKVIVNDIHIKKEKSPSPRIEANQLRILQISDMHIENISITPERLLKELKGQHIDMIALTGDFLDRKRSLPKLVPYLQAFRELDPAYGTFAVFGNHDYVLRYPYFHQLKDLLQDYGIETLQNENRSMEIDGKKINIIGIDDFGTSHSDLAKSYEGLENGYNLVFTHDPNVVLEMKDHSFDYLLSGHFHGGQIHWPKPYHLIKMGKLARMSMVKGLQNYKNRTFYISEGLGQTGLNIRLGSLPEITFHNLELAIEEKTEEKPAELDHSAVVAG